MTIDLAALTADYFALQPDPGVAAQRVAFGTSGHRGSASDTAFNEAHILAVTQAVADWRVAHGVDGPLFLGRDTHSLSEPAWITAREVLAGGWYFATETARILGGEGGALRPDEGAELLRQKLIPELRP